MNMNMNMCMSMNTDYNNEREQHAKSEAVSRKLHYFHCILFFDKRRRAFFGQFGN